MSEICHLKTPLYSADSINLENQTQLCYLYQHISNNREDRAIEWINKYNQIYLKQKDIESVLYAAVQQNMDVCINLLKEKELVTETQINHYKTYWNTLMLKASTV